AVDLSIPGDIPFAAEEYSTLPKKTPGNITTSAKCFGQVEHVWLSGRKFITTLAGWMRHFLRTWKKLIYAGKFIEWVSKCTTADRVRYITWVLVHYPETIREKPIIISETD